jgi:hypothetical protein
MVARPVDVCVHRGDHGTRCPYCGAAFEPRDETGEEPPVSGFVPTAVHGAYAERDSRVSVPA